MGLQASLTSAAEIGWFRVYVTPPGGEETEVTMFRGSPVQVSAMGTSDPFGPTTMSLEFPQITPWDQAGQGDLVWLQPYASVDVVWHNMEGYSYSWEWEGFIVDETVTFSDSSSSYIVEAKGALYQLDNYLAKPSFPQQPIPYETLISDAFDPEKHTGLQTNPLRVEWPTGWNVTLPTKTSKQQWFMRPYGVSPGETWSGLASRSTGTWEPTLSSFVQGLLTVMYDEGGNQWSIRCDRGRYPVLYLRQQPALDAADNIVINLGTPGINFELSRDFSQAANIIYGMGQDIAGAAYSGAEVSADGTETTYEPYAFSAAVYPDKENPFYEEDAVAREVQLQFPNGMDESAAKEVAQAQYYRFADPGFTGTITLRTDPALNNGVVQPRMLINAGRKVLLNGFRGGQLLMHITTTDMNMNTGEMTLTVDSKFRDALTVDEVRERTRDALSPIRLLKPGQFTPTTQDMLMPWSYNEGSGIMPFGARELFLTKLKKQEGFPWRKTVKAYPPKKFPHYYVKIKNPNRLTNANRNWAMRSGSTEDSGIPIRMAQQGTIRLSQICAYDEDGNVLPVRFHVSIYNNRGIGVDDMPQIPEDGAKILKPAGATYNGNDNTPFFQDAFEEIKGDGSVQSDEGYTYHTSAGFVMGWGNYYEPAGYSPGLASRGAPKSGMLTDEAPWTFDTTVEPNFDPQDPNMKPWKEGVGMLYAMVYCDDHPGPIYFLGRFFRQEPGA